MHSKGWSKCIRRDRGSITDSGDLDRNDSKSLGMVMLHVWQYVYVRAMKP